MRSNDSSAPSESLETSDPAAPGWLFVLSWSPQQIGGVSQVVKSLVGQFRDGRVFSPQLLVDSEGPEPGGTAEPELLKPYYFELRSPVDRRRPIRGLLSFLLRLPFRCRAMRRIIDQHNIRIINPHFPGLESLLILAMKSLRQFDGRLVLSFHGSDVASALSTTGLERHLWKMLLRHADHIVVVSNSLGSELLTLEQRIAGKVRTISNGVDSAFFGPVEDEPRPRLPALNHERRILSVGSFTLNKGHDVLIRAFGHVLSKVPDARLVLVGGDGPEIEPIRQLINSKSLTHKVNIFKDVPHERIPAFLSQAQLFVLASRREGFGLAVTEAAAAKVPVVCTNAEGLRELITDGVTGRLVPIDDHIALADAIVEVLTHPDEAQQMALKFYEHVRSNLTWHHAYEKYIQLSR